MRFRVFAFSFFAAYLVCANGLSQCVWHCKNDIDSYFFLPTVPGQPPGEIRCKYFPSTLGNWLYTDLGILATHTLPDGVKDFLVYSKDTCDENCWAQNGPFPLQDAIYFESYSPVLGGAQWPTFRCVKITPP